MSKFLVKQGGIFNRGTCFDTLNQAQIQRGAGTITVELSEDEYVQLINDIQNLQRTLSVKQQEHQKSLQALRQEHERTINVIYTKHQAEIKAYRGRLNAMGRAVARWREKAGVKPPADKPEVIMAERRKRKIGDRTEWQYIEQHALPVERNPHLAREAWSWLQQNLGGNKEKMDRIERVYFNEKHGWVAVIVKNW